MSRDQTEEEYSAYALSICQTLKALKKKPMVHLPIKIIQCILSYHELEYDADFYNDNSGANFGTYFAWTQAWHDLHKQIFYDHCAVETYILELFWSRRHVARKEPFDKFTLRHIIG